MSSDNAIEVAGIGKRYQIYRQPQDRLKQMILPRLCRALGRPAPVYYHDFWALREVSFSVRRGETVGIIGTNGSGKSTLLQIICGVRQPTLGRVAVSGRIAALLELGAGFNPEFTGRQNAMLNAQILGLQPQQIEERMPEIEAFADIGEFFDQPVKTYSSGMYVRVAFAVQACIEPEILIVDEALAVGDARFQAKCMERIGRLRQNGTSILFVSHDVASVRLLCDRAVWLDRGRLRMIGAVTPVTAAYMEHLFSHDGGAPPGETDTGLEVDLAIDHTLGPASKPINHWGSHPGIIQRVVLLDGDGKECWSFMDRERITVLITLRLPPDIDREGLSVAFSFKNLTGHDLVVGTTRTDGTLELSGLGPWIDVAFTLDNVLNAGSYMVAAAVEKRSEFDVHYYEHIDGAAFFQVASSTKRLGVAVPIIEKHARPLEQTGSDLPSRVSPFRSSPPAQVPMAS